MHFIDTEDVAGIENLPERNAPGRLPSYLIKKRLLPNPNDLKIGDIVLVSPRFPTWSQRRIINKHLKAYAADHACWTHAAIYIGNGLLCEAVLSGVREHSVYEYFEAYKVRVRRAEFASEHERFAVAIRAMRRLGSKYSIGSIYTIATSSKKKFSKPGGQSYSQRGGMTSMICSMLCFDSYFEVTNESPLNDAVDLATPADFSQSGKFSDVQVGLLRLPEPSNM